MLVTMERSDGLKGLLEHSLPTTNSTILLSRNYVVQQFPSCEVKEKVDRSREVPKWETLHRDVLAVIFDKLELMDLTLGVSRVCTSWFLASHNKTLWNTVDLTKLKQVDFSYFMEFEDRVRPVIFFEHRVDEEEVAKGLSFRSIFIKISKFFFDYSVVHLTLMGLLDEITKLSRMAPKNLFFHFSSYVKTEDLMFAAERMPNIEKLVLPVWCYKTKESCQFVFSQWKNLKTLIIAQDYQLRIGTFDFQIVGENCSNLTNFKYLGFLQDKNVEQIVRYLENLKRLSLRCSYVTIDGVISLITGLQNLTVLNLSHCIYLALDPDTVPDDYFVQAPIQKLEEFIKCTPDCKICKRRYSWSYLSED
ncbi:PREDICTED: putative F-box protein At4g11580 [Camelina sativa]|uniref:F-box protein At4g11580 n=1 Tax=Camelina sativa TaxID=90675 RepID=A0ABM0VFX7_CAMSA|nr:PREDICTED: putative F-box protein At4g11580 [Camelina sativa]XP_010455568.1 PREDICTED: putative F-box protein At4g11580 [Camelina sativa]